MIFHSVEFLFFFLPITILGFFVLGTWARKTEWCFGWLALCSVIFYGWGVHAFVALIVGSSIFNFLIARAIGRLGQSTDARKRQIILLFGIIGNLAVLGYFKYADFFVANVFSLFGLNSSSLEIILPLAISFFTLQQIAFLVDVSRGQANEGSFLRYLLFVTFFPQLIAGPIVHHSEMLPQFSKHKGRLNLNDIAEGLCIFLLGLFKKLVLADGMASISDPIFLSADTGIGPGFFLAWIAVLAFSLQIYFDFSAYTDMAIGLARMFSIRLPKNFDSPYKATSIIDFWRCWHMTLSRFLRDYIYIPLGGNRNGTLFRYRNLILTMLLGGLWHGAAWGFVIWGGLHGLYLSVNHLWRSNSTCAAISANRWFRPFGWLVTFVAVSIAWIFFRAETFDGAIQMFSGILALNGVILPPQLIAEFPFLSIFASPGLDEARPMLLLPFVANALFVLCSTLLVVAAPTVHDLTHTRRVVILLLTAGLTVQGLFYGVPTEFIYFRF